MKGGGGGSAHGGGILDVKAIKGLGLRHMPRAPTRWHCIGWPGCPEKAVRDGPAQQSENGGAVGRFTNCFGQFVEGQKQPNSNECDAP